MQPFGFSVRSLIQFHIVQVAWLGETYIDCLSKQYLTALHISAINANIANGNQSFDNFVQAAKLLTNPPTV